MVLHTAMTLQVLMRCFQLSVFEYYVLEEI